MPLHRTGKLKLRIVGQLQAGRGYFKLELHRLVTGALDFDAEFRKIHGKREG